MTMPTDRDDDGCDSSRRVPVDAIPDPVVGYVTQDGEVLVAATNDAFETVFEGVSAGTTARHWLHTATDADESSVDEVCSSLADGRALDTELEVPDAASAGAGTYRLRTLESANDSTGDSDGDGTGDSRNDSAGAGEGDGTRDEAGVDGYVVVSELEPSATRDVEVDRIASVVSHDLRNPLDVANAHLRAARETGDDDHFDEVRQAHERMERIIRDVLTLAREGHALDRTEEVDPGAVATDAWGVVDTGPASLTVADDLPAVEADPDRLQRLFENLFRNSVEHARPAAGPTDPDRETTPEASVRVRVGSTNEGWFVADDGVGIPGDERERVFEPGYSTGDSGSGAGLGLTIVEQVADAHDWNVSLASGSSGGARFEFHPVAADD